MVDLVGELREKADVVIIDAPPVLAASDAAILSTVVDGVILVIDINKTKRREIRRAREAIEAVNGKIIGIVVNRFRIRDRTYYYEYAESYGANKTSGRPPESRDAGPPLPSSLTGQG
jgi:Mrp family chromosome partitioning ATPase